MLSSLVHVLFGSTVPRFTTINGTGRNHQCEPLACTSPIIANPHPFCLVPSWNKYYSMLRWRREEMIEKINGL